MTTEEKQSHVENILKGSDLFDDLTGLSVDLLNFRPSPDRWNIHEHIIHCLDVDIANFTRYRVAIVKPGSAIIGMDDQWTDKLKYETIGIGEAVQTIKLIRRLTHAHLSTLVEDDWTQYSFLYAKYGDLNFEVFLPVYYRHPVSHREMIDKLIDEWRNR